MTICKTSIRVRSNNHIYEEDFQTVLHGMQSSDRMKNDFWTM